jgi:hypothetical protein
MELQPKDRKPEKKPPLLNENLEPQTAIEIENDILAANATGISNQPSSQPLVTKEHHQAENPYDS